LTDDEPAFSDSRSYMPVGMDYVWSFAVTPFPYPWMTAGPNGEMFSIPVAVPMDASMAAGVAPMYAATSAVWVARGSAPMPVAAEHVGNSKSLQQWTEKGVTSIRWRIDAKKLRGRDKVAVSPRLDVLLRDVIVPFKLSLSPIASGTGKGGGSFKGSQGRGKIQLKCEDEIGWAEFTLTVELSLPDLADSPVRSTVHDFKQNGICTCHDVWDFVKAVDQETQEFAVGLDISIR